MEQYLPTHRMRDIIADNPLLLPVLSRFGIPLGFGDSQVADVCKLNVVDCPTFLAVANLISGKPWEAFGISLQSLVNYLKKAHGYFLNYVLPGIRRRLIEAISTGVSGDMSVLLLKFYDEYVEEVRRHMDFEDSHVFTAVADMLESKTSSDFKISDFESNHHPIAAKLREMKEIFICHFKADGARVDQLNSVLYDIITCEHDITMHCRVEDVLFIPAVAALEESLQNKKGEEESQSRLDANGDIELTAREKDIVTAIARGLSNKEIADVLFISTHTVATHRRNICAKLNIHSASGMTIYAILHGLINMEEAERLLQRNG